MCIEEKDLGAVGIFGKLFRPAGVVKSRQAYVCPVVENFKR
jgi:hypothetical protein